MIRTRLLLALLGLLAAFAFIAVESADARGGRGFSFGSRGARTFSAPPPTATAPKGTAPIQRSTTQPSAKTGTPAPSPAAGGFFGRPGLLGGLAAGFLGAGLFGLLFGHGFIGGLGGFASILGLLLQIALVVIVARLAWNWWQRRNAPETAMAGGPALRDLPPDSTPSHLNLGGGTGAMPGAGMDEVGLQPSDYDAFERLLTEVQGFYGTEDLTQLRSRVTPEMLSYFAEELAENASQGRLDKVSNVKLLQGDLAESWCEGNVEYATVAMRYTLIDRMVDRASGTVIDGSDEPQEVTEIWTFMRARGGSWLLSAIQQLEDA
jgi:predicted lipid-binding transport protein (Tim44 family)